MTWELFAVFVGSSLRLAVPLLLAGTGELVSERAGVLNMSIEGMMLAGAFGQLGAWMTDIPLVGLAVGVIAVLPVALLQAVLSNSLRANQIVTGIGINILVLGATTLAYREIFGERSRDNFLGCRNGRRPYWRHPGVRASRVPAGMAPLRWSRDHSLHRAPVAVQRARHSHPRRRY